MSTKHYILLFAMTLSLLAGGVVVLNRVIDPFWYYRDVSIEGLNAVKPKFRRYERHVKPAVVRHEQPASLIFGSSFSEIGFDPLHPALSRAGKSFNFALAGASWDMVSCYAHFALKHDRALRQIVLGIHPVAMPKKDCTNEIVRMENPDERAFLFSYDAFEASINTILEQRKNKPSHTKEGLYFYTRSEPGTFARFREYFSKFQVCPAARGTPASLERSSSNDFDKLDLGGLHELIRSARKQGIDIKLVVYPRHALSFEREYQCGNRHIRWSALEQIVSEVNALHGGSVEVWDFESYGPVGTETVSDAPGIYWQDPEHFNYEVGNIMLDEMFRLKSPHFGHRLSMENIPELIEFEKMSRKAHIENHPEFLIQLKELSPNYRE